MLLSNGLDSRLRGNDGLEVARNLKKKNRNRTSRIPACAGMTNPSARKPAPRHSHEPTSRHSHESG
ncbi:hypothetical protein FGF64_12970, partial [Neisseria meningitidis]|nr:hypothetical protein [Neisseria meningitidis]